MPAEPGSKPIWATPQGVAILIAVYLLAHLGVRLWVGPGLGVDDAEQALFAQHWLPSYRLRAPPLFTWALMALSPVMGFGVVPISLLRYLLLGMVLGFTWLTARRLIRDPALAALSAFSVTAIYVFGYYSHHDLTHTATLSAFLAASWYAFVRVCQTPSLRWYLALGASLGLGTLGKWNCLILGAALPLACLLTPRYRGLVLNWRIVPAGLLAAAIVLPPALFALQIGPASGDDMDAVLGARTGSLAWVLMKGTASLALATLVYPQPFLVLFLIGLGAIAWRGLRAPVPAAATAVEPIPSSALLATVMAVAVGLHWLLVPLAHATDFPERLLQPALMILPVYLFMLVERGLTPEDAPARRIRNFAITLAVVAGVALVARIGIHLAGADRCGTACRDQLPAAAIAAGLRQAGYGGKGTVVVRDVHLGGNLRLQFPQARFMATGFPPKVWPKAAPRLADSGQCLALWTDYKGKTDQYRADIRTYLLRDLAVPADAKGREGEVVAHYSGAKRTYRVFYELYDTPQGDCR